MTLALDRPCKMGQTRSDWLYVEFWCFSDRPNQVDIGFWGLLDRLDRINIRCWSIWPDPSVSSSTWPACDGNERTRMKSCVSRYLHVTSVLSSALSSCPVIIPYHSTWRLALCPALRPVLPAILLAIRFVLLTIPFCLPSCPNSITCDQNRLKITWFGFSITQMSGWKIMNITHRQSPDPL